MSNVDDCIHLEFIATCSVSRLFADDAVDVLSHSPDSVAIDLSIICVDCRKAVRFEGPIGVGVGPGAAPTVSFDGTELRAAGHMGENATPPISMRARFT